MESEKKDKKVEIGPTTAADIYLHVEGERQTDPATQEQIKRGLEKYEARKRAQKHAQDDEE